MTTHRTAHDTTAWTDVTTHIDVVHMEIDGRDAWLATDDVGLIAMSPTEEGLEAVLGDAVVTRVPRWSADSQPNDA